MPWCWSHLFIGLHIEPPYCALVSLHISTPPPPPTDKHSSNCQYYPPLEAAVFALGVWRTSRSPVIRPSPRCPTYGVSLSGLGPHNEELRESREPRGWVRTVLQWINAAHKCLVAAQFVIWQTHSQGSTLCGLQWSQQWAQWGWARLAHQENRSMPLQRGPVWCCTCSCGFLFQH